MAAKWTYIYQAISINPESTLAPPSPPLNLKQTEIVISLRLVIIRKFSISVFSVGDPVLCALGLLMTQVFEAQPFFLNKSKY